MHIEFYLGRERKAILQKRRLCLARGLTCSIPGYTLKLGMFSRFKELKLRVNLNTKLIQEGVCTLCLCYGPCAETGQFTEIYQVIQSQDCWLSFLISRIN